MSELFGSSVLVMGVLILSYLTGVLVMAGSG